jgi:hypothetical protein
MTHVLIDPSLRRARIVRFAVAAIALVLVGLSVIFALELSAGSHLSMALASPRRASNSAGRRPVRGRNGNGRH